MAAALYKMHDFDGAATLWQDIALALPRIHGKTTDWLVTVQSNIGLSYLQAGRFAEAADANGRALEFARSLHDEMAPRTQSIRFQRAFCLVELGRPEGVARLLDGLDPAALQLADPSDEWRGRIAYVRGRLALLDGGAAPASRLLEKAADLLKNADPETRYAPALVRRWLTAARRLEAPESDRLEIR